MRMRFLFSAGWFALVACSTTAAFCADARVAAIRTTPSTMTQTITLRLTIDDTVLTAELEGGATARDFLRLLPLSLALSDYNNTEKIAQLPRRLSTAGAPAGFTPVAGDIAFYAPWGNLAIFYQGFAYSKGLIKLGRIRGDLEVLRNSPASLLLIEQE